MSKDIGIIVTGRAGTGKSTVMELIYEAMLEAGFTKEAIHIDYNDGAPPKTSLGVRRQSITDPERKTGLTIEERQTRRGISASKPHLMLDPEGARMFLVGLDAHRRNEQSRVHQLRRPLEYATPGSEAFTQHTKWVEDGEKKLANIEMMIATVRNFLAVAE